MILILDNADNADQVSPILSARGGYAILVTSRGILATLDGVTHVHLDVLADDEAVAFLGQLVGPERVADELDASQRIARLCGMLPLSQPCGSLGPGGSPVPDGPYASSPSGWRIHGPGSISYRWATWLCGRPSR